MTDETMSEGKAKKPGLLRRILWWVWVILLSGLLLACIVFAAPWKVIALIAIFLVAATILPRIYRKWFWLGVGVVVLTVVVWVLLPDNNDGWRPYTFDKELAQLQAKYAVPDSENAAIIYNQILENWKQKEANEPNLPNDWHRLTLNGSWLSKDQPQIAAYIQYHKDTIDRLIQASQFKRCIFPISANIFIKEQLDRNSSMRKWAYLLIAAGNNNIAEGNINEAIEKYFAVLRLGQHACQQPTSIDMLVGVGCEALAMGGINNFVVCGDANEFYLGKMEQAVSEIKHDWNTALTGFIDSDKLMFKNLCGVMCYQINAQGKIRFSHDHNPYARTRKWTKEHPYDVNAIDADIFPGYWFKKLFKANTILYWFYAPQTPEELSKIVDACFDTMAASDFDWSKEPPTIPIESLFQWKLNFRYLTDLTSQMNKKMYFGLHDSYLRSAAKQKGTLLIIALRRYKNANGHWPEKLEDIKNSVPPEVFVDPINGDSFVYKRTEKNFALYSKGKNGLDEGGERETKNITNYPYIETIKDDEMIWPYKSKSSIQQEVKADANEGVIK